jgi:ribosome biogenesis GTPase
MQKGLVVKSTGSRYFVADKSDNIIICVIRGKFRVKGIKSTNPIAVGDFVFFSFDEKTNLGVIKQIEDRKNYILRKSVNLSKQYHIIASNIDVAFILVTLKQPETSTEFIDRILISAEAFNLKVILIFNKIDLLDENTKLYLKYLISVYQNVGYKCIETNLLEDYNIDLVKQEMKDNTSVIIGHSGTGKSTLIKKVEPNITAKIGKISDYHKTGKHTTTFAEMFKLSFGGRFIDTPGIRGFGLFDYKKEELHHFFPEIFKISKDCKYQNCTHIHEPQCAVKENVETGVISEERYNNYLNIFFDEDSKHRA